LFDGGRTEGLSRCNVNQPKVNVLRILDLEIHVVLFEPLARVWTHMLQMQFAVNLTPNIELCVRPTEHVQVVCLGRVQLPLVSDRTRSFFDGASEVFQLLIRDLVGANVQVFALVVGGRAAVALGVVTTVVQFLSPAVFLSGQYTLVAFASI